MMEVMLQQLRHSYGMEDISFMIVNSMEPWSVARIDELQNRVSFQVYQETDEEKIWNIMGGGKDDMFIYDRCGRLSSYIPFPQSIIHVDQPIVLSALLEAYFQQPCGAMCREKSPLEIETTTLDFPEFVTELYDEDNSTTMLNESTVTENFDPDNTTELFDDTFWMQNTDDTEEDIRNESVSVTGNTLNNSQGDVNMTKSSSQGFINSLFSYFWRPKSMESPMVEEAQVDNNNNSISNNGSNRVEESNDIMRKNSKMNKTENRCLGAEENVCRDWSKKRMMKAKECCDSVGAEHQISVQCKKFNRRRCKKLHTLLKCCLKTKVNQTETTTENDQNLGPKPSM